MQPKVPLIRHNYKNVVLWKLIIKSDHLARFSISVLMPKNLNTSDIAFVACLLLNQQFSKSHITVHSHNTFAPWLDCIQHQSRKKRQ